MGWRDGSTAKGYALPSPPKKSSTENETQVSEYGKQMLYEGIILLAFFTASVLRHDPTELSRLPQTCYPLVSTSQVSQTAGVCHISTLFKCSDEKHATAIKNNVISNWAVWKRLYFALYWHIFPDIPSQLHKKIFLYFWILTPPYLNYYILSFHLHVSNHLLIITKCEWQVLKWQDEFCGHNLSVIYLVSYRKMPNQ